MRNRLNSVLFWFAFVQVVFCGLGHAATEINEPAVIGEDTTWTGSVRVGADVLVLPGAVLTIAPGTEVTVLASESTKTQPEYLSSLTEITVRGELRALGEEGAPIRFRYEGEQQDGAGQWAGINVDGGRVRLAYCTVSQAESGVVVWDGSAAVRRSRLVANRTGLSVLGSGAEARVFDTEITDNEYGIVVTEGGRVDLENSAPRGNHQQDRLEWKGEGYRPSAPVPEVEVSKLTSPYQSESLLGTVVWKDHVVVNGVIRVPAKSRLIIMPGTVVEFTRADSNGDGIGENGLLVMGMLVAKGTKDRPIVFRSAAKDRRMGDWDAINIYVSDGFQNLLEYCIIEDAYRGLHFHFSNVLVSHVEVRNNYRGLQFQESLVTIEESYIHGNKNALRARDSELVFRGNRVYDNLSGPNIFRVTGLVEDNVIAGNLGDGLRVREGAVEVSGNAIIGNRDGVLVAYANYGECTGNVVSGNAERGIILKGTDNVRVEGNFIQGNGTNGISLLRARATIIHNQIANNGGRGIGIQSFDGQIRRNNLLGNREYDLGLEGTMDIDARENYWGGADLGRVIYDRRDEPTRGQVQYEPVLPAPVPFTWPRPDVLVDTVWEGVILLPPRVKSRPRSKLTIRPGTTVRMSRDGLLWLEGVLEAVGMPEKRIVFTAAEDVNGVYWNQMTTEMSKAVYRYCDFENASMAVHSHFSHVEIRGCRFRDNESGFRFRGGPVLVEDSRFEGNDYGIVCYLARGTVRGCSIRNNGIGILVRAEQRGGMHVNGNNIVDNRHYNIRMGDFNTGGNIDARNNWWGNGDPTVKLFDERLEPGVGFVDFEPVATEPFAIAVPVWQ